MMEFSKLFCLMDCREKLCVCVCVSVQKMMSKHCNSCRNKERQQVRATRRAKRINSGAWAGERIPRPK